MVVRLNRIDQHQNRNKSTALSATPTAKRPISLTVVPTNQLPICPDGWTLNIRYSCHFKEEHVFLEDSPVSNDVYQPESLDTALPFYPQRSSMRWEDL